MEAGVPPPLERIRLRRRTDEAERPPAPFRDPLLAIARQHTTRVSRDGGNVDLDACIGTIGHGRARVARNVLKRDTQWYGLSHTLLPFGNTDAEEVAVVIH